MGAIATGGGVTVATGVTAGSVTVTTGSAGFMAGATAGGAGRGAIGGGVGTAATGATGAGAAGGGVSEPKYIKVTTPHMSRRATLPPTNSTKVRAAIGSLRLAMRTTGALAVPGAG
ncbi:hypothetical protein RAHE111665_14430 [Rariglobus hedericola]